jgi:murein DD-endopeptidase MepM/ murein hydrolase activator NlpD
MIMREGQDGHAVRSLTFPWYAPRLALALAALLVIVLTVGGFWLVYFWQRSSEVTPLRAENIELHQAIGKLPALEAEMERHREFTRRVAKLIGMDVPNFEDSTLNSSSQSQAATVAQFSGRDTLGSSAISGSDASLSPRGTLVTNCKADPNNQPRGMPVLGRVSQIYSPNAANPVMRHYGIDLAAPEGLPVYAAASGTIESAGEDKIFGRLIVIDHGNGFKTSYGHNSKLLKKAGDHVQRGNIIALSGNTGISTAPHVHYEIQHNGTTVDPAAFLGP